MAVLEPGCWQHVATLAALMSDLPATTSRFETSLEELERIVSVMEAGGMPLEEALAAYQKGMALLRHCEDTLAQAERRVKLLEQEHLVDLPKTGDPT